MNFWNVTRVSDALREQIQGAIPVGSGEFVRVTTDTRSIRAGDLFVALRGERFDAHDFLADAVGAGASGVVVSDALRASALGVPVFVVTDTLVALGLLGRFWRRAWGKTIVAVAGSNGKTSTKDLTSAALGSIFSVHATTGNLNNRIGVPLSLLSIPPATDVAVIEVGTSLPGEVEILREIVEADIAIVTSIAEEHLEGLGDLDGVLREESAIFDRVPLGICPSAQPEVGAAAKDKAIRIVETGLESGDLVPDSWRMVGDGLGEINIGGISVRPPLRGAHNLRNTMLALAAARECGVSFEDAARGIAAMPKPKMRVAWEQLGASTLINDAYNSNPGSARAAIDLLTESGGDRQRVIVLGTMRELGPRSAECHDDIARRALESGASVVAGIGDFAAALARVGGGDDRVVTAEDVGDLWPRLEPRLEKTAVILLKASRGVQLERIVPLLTSWAQ